MVAEKIADEPFGQLPSPGRIQLAGSRIEGAVAEVRFVADEPELSSASAERLLERLSSSENTLRLDRTAKHELALNLTPGGEVDAAANVTDHGWRVMTPDEQVVFTVLPGQASVQVRGYTRWSESLEPMLAALIDALVEVVRPVIIQRIGLRYINVLEAEAGTGHAHWDGRIHPSFLGPVTHPLLGPRVRACQQRVDLELDSEVGATVSHGPLIDGGAPSRYLVDMDLYQQASRQFDASEVLHVAKRLNRTALALFLQLITVEQITDMRPRSLDAAAHDEEGEG